MIHRDDLAVGFLAPPHPVDSGEIVRREMLVFYKIVESSGVFGPR